MAYKCVHCSEVYEDGAKEILTGCKCGGKFFFYIKQEQLNKILNDDMDEPELNENEKKQIEGDVREIAGIKDSDSPVFLDFESIRILKPGKYLLDLQKLFAIDKPRIYKLEDGKYIVDLTAIRSVKDASEKELV